jgi:hypothetical protein
MSVLDYSFLFRTFSFAGGGRSVHPGAVLSRVGGCIGESRVVRDAHLYLLQFRAGCFGASCRGEMASFGWHRETFHELGVQDVTGFHSD